MENKYKCICGSEMFLESSFDFDAYGSRGEGVINSYYCSDKKCSCSMLFFIPDVDYDNE